MTEPGRYTSGRIAVANLSASIEAQELRRAEGATFDSLVELSKLLFVRGDVLGRIADHDRAELVGTEAIALSPDAAAALYIRARLAGRFHRFEEASAVLDQALAAGYPRREIDLERAALLQATGRYDDALVLRERMAKDEPGIHTLGALASLLAEMGRWLAAENSYAAALDADNGVSPLPCSQLLFEWGVSAMRRGDLDRAEAIFVKLDAILPAHVPGRGHRAEVALARGQVDIAMTLIMPLLETSDDPEYRAIYAEILAARCDGKAASEAERAAAAYELLLARRPEAYADHAAAFFMGVGKRPQRAVELASANWKLRDTPRSRSLLAKALGNAQQVSLVQGSAAGAATTSCRQEGHLGTGQVHRHQIVVPSCRGLVGIVAAFAGLVLGFTAATPSRADHLLIQRAMDLVTFGGCSECVAAGAAGVRGMFPTDMVARSNRSQWVFQ